MHKTRLPIAQPCHEDWDSMDAVERGRFCHSCSKKVHHFSAMTEREATTLLRESACGDERICVRYSCDAQGRVRFKPERAVAAVAATALSVALAACTPHDRREVKRSFVDPVIEVFEGPQEVMGEMVAVDPEPEIEELMGDVEYVPPEDERDDEPQPCALTKPEAAVSAQAPTAPAPQTKASGSGS